MNRNTRMYRRVTAVILALVVLYPLSQFLFLLRSILGLPFSALHLAMLLAPALLVYVVLKLVARGGNVQNSNGGDAGI